MINTVFKLIGRARSSLPRRANRTIKKLHQKLFLKKAGEAKFAIVVGCQRSGTTMLINLLSKSSFAFAFGEMDSPIMQRNCRISKDTVIRNELSRSSAHLVVAKPICDSQWTDQLLDRFPGSKAIWIYRNYNDVVNSSLKKFKGQSQRMEWFVNEDWKSLGWRTERIEKSHPIVRLVQSVHQENATRADAAALMWVLRTGLYFDLNLDQDERVKLVKYESLVTETTARIKDICQFLGIEFEEKLVSRVHAKSISKNAAPELNPKVEIVCKQLQSRLNQFWESKQEAAKA